MHLALDMEEGESGDGPNSANILSGVTPPGGRSLSYSVESSIDMPSLDTQTDKLDISPSNTSSTRRWSGLSEKRHGCPRNAISGVSDRPYTIIANGHPIVTPSRDITSKSGEMNTRDDPP